MGHHRPEGPAAVADGILLGRRQLRGGAHLALRNEDRVVAETVRPPAWRSTPRRGGPRRRARRRPGGPARRRRRSARCGAASGTSPSWSSSSSRFATSSPCPPDHRAENTPGAPPSTSTQMPESSASAGSPVARATARALIRAFSAKVTPSRDAALGAVTEIEHLGDQAGSATILRNSSTLCALCVASTIRAALMRSASAALCSAARSAQPATPRSSSASSSRSVERRALGGALHLDERPRRR